MRHLDRAVSMTLESAVREPAVRFRPASLRDRWKDAASAVEAPPDYGRMMEADSPPAEDVPYFESFEEFREEELRVKVCKESIRSNLQNTLRSGVGHLRALEDVEDAAVTADDVAEKFVSRSQLEKNVAFLWAAFLRRPDLLRGLLRAGADARFCDDEGLNALHMAAFSGCVESCRLLVAQGVDVNLLRKSYTPLHSAAFGNAPDAARYLLGRGAKVEFWKLGLVGDDKSGTALHSAVKANSADVLQILTEACEDVNCVEPGGCAALHLAADLGHTACLKVLLDATDADADVRTREKRATALHLACDGGYTECVGALLARGADPSLRNTRGQTPLHLAARAQSIESVEMLLATGKVDVDAMDDDSRTPLHAALGKDLHAFDMVELLIGYGADVNREDKYGYTPLHVAALNEMSQCVETLLFHGADVTTKTKGGASALNIVVRKTPASLAMVNEKFNCAISVHDPEVSRREVELKMDFRALLRNGDVGEIGYLKTFVDEGQKDVLQHPLCEAFLHLKWQKIRKFYFARLAFCVLYVLSLTVYVWSGPARERSPDPVLAAEWYALVVLTLFEVVRKLYGLSGYASARQYLQQPENVLDWLVIASVFVTSSIIGGSSAPWQSHVAAFAVLLAWLNLMYSVGQLPLLGSYVAMYSKVQTEFFKLLLAYSFLLVGFTVSFAVVFPGSDFDNIFYGFLKVLAMMTGELDLGNLHLKPGEHALIGSAHVIFLLFLLFVTVILMNLLVGIAVHDIQGLRKTAGLAKLERQTRLISYIELALFGRFLPSYLLRLLRWTALVSPSAYRVVLHVKPLNPREKRLPRHVLTAAYEIAKARRRNKHTVSSQVSTRTACTRYGDADDSASVYGRRRRGLDDAAMLLLSDLRDEVLQLRKAVDENRSLLDALSNKCTDC